MEEKYKEINNFLNLYCNEIQDSFFYKNMDYYFEISYLMLDIIEEHDSLIQNSDEENAKNFNDLSGVESLDIVRNFIKERVPYYSEVFDVFLRNGTYDFVDSEERIGSKSGYKEGHRYIDINLLHTPEDPFIIFHEFIHQMNLNPVYEEYRGLNKRYEETRYALTEAISIYFETLLFDYMEEIGYDKKQVALARRFRTTDCYNIGNVMNNQILLVDSFEKFDKLSDNTFDEREKYELANWESKEDYEAIINEAYDRIIKEDIVYPDVLGRYMIGTLIGYYAARKGIDIEKFDDLNDLVQYDTILNSLNEIGIPVNEYDKLLDVFEKEVINIDNTIKKEDKKEK